MKNSQSFIDRAKGKTAAVIGIGISNTPLIDFLLSCGVKVTARDMKQLPTAKTLEEKGVKLCLGEHYLDGLTEDMIFRAPGIRPDLPQFREAVERGAELTSEMELFFSLCPCPILAVTGSDGKTTTTTLTYTFLMNEAKNHRVFVGGNIGKPLLPDVDSMTADDFAVVELSSFQLQSMRMSPAAAAVTNVTPNHLNWHTGMDEYTEAKENVFLHPVAGKKLPCTENTRLVLNYGCQATHDMVKLSKSPVTYFSAKVKPQFDHENVTAIIYDDNGMIVRETKDGKIEVLACDNIKIPGRHNVENYMTAISLTWGLVGFDTIRETAKSFGGVEHRCEFVREKDGVKYYNSSIDSSPTRTEAALHAFTQKLIVICGGYDKHIPYEPLAKPLIDCAKTVILTGATASKIKTALLNSPDYHGNPDIVDCDTFEDAVTMAHRIAKSGDIVILSPASASFDRFKNFEERGNYFKELVRKL